MIDAVKENASYNNKYYFDKQNITNTAPSFKQRYAELVQSEKSVAARNKQDVVQQKNVDRCEVKNNDLKCFFDALNQQADGSLELTEKDIEELKQKYDLYNLTNEKKSALLLELNQRNVLSYQDCRNAKISLVPLSSENLWGWNMSVDTDEGRCIFKPKNENRTTFVDGKSRTSAMHLLNSSQNIQEKYQDYEKWWRSEYERLLDEENRDVPACLEYADSYARIAKVFKSLM